jgi:hypothetical protein
LKLDCAAFVIFHKKQEVEVREEKQKKCLRSLNLSAKTIARNFSSASFRLHEHHSPLDSQPLQHFLRSRGETREKMFCAALVWSIFLDCSTKNIFFFNKENKNIINKNYERKQKRKDKKNM